jgi:hypothetical protein
MDLLAAYCLEMSISVPGKWRYRTLKSRSDPIVAALAADPILAAVSKGDRAGCGSPLIANWPGHVICQGRLPYCLYI